MEPKNNQIHVSSSFNHLTREEMLSWLKENVQPLTEYQVKQLCLKVEEMNTAKELLDEMVSLGMKMGE